MELTKYLTGKGMDVSRESQIDTLNCKKVFIEPDNLYSLREHAKPESMDFVYSKNLINETKFHRILIKEWFYFCKVGGAIIIEMKSNSLLNFEEMAKECSLLLKDKAEIIESDKSEGGGKVVIKKLKPALKKGDSMDSWTFGIITDGKRKEWVDHEIDSIVRLKVPHYEIIVCGNYCPKGMKNVRFIPFKPKMAWITRKKNLICQKAKYENMVITHDRFLFDKEWYKGMKRYGNYYEVLSCAIKDLKGRRADDWITYGLDKKEGVEKEDIVGNLGLLDYRDWDKNGYIGGGFYILKKSIWQQFKWDESLIWGQAEDLKMSRAFYKAGIVARFNPFSLCHSLSERGNWAAFKLNKTRFVRPSDRPLLRRMKTWAKRFCMNYIIK